MIPDRADVDVWLLPLDRGTDWPSPTPAELERASHFVLPHLRERHLRSHAALRAILRTYTEVPLEFGAGEHGKPYLAALPDLRFNLSHSHEMALVAVAWGVEVGVDVEWLRPLPECLAIAERFFPPEDADALREVAPDGREVAFLHHWTRIEAVLKASGLGLYGAGVEPAGKWQVRPVEVGVGYCGAVAAACGEIMLTVRRR